MCMHVAAALYGVGVRLDEDPLLFFELRGQDVGRCLGCCDLEPLRKKGNSEKTQIWYCK